MKERLIVDDHPAKVNVSTFTARTDHDADDGWVNMSVQWLITKDSVGYKTTVFGVTTFPPGARHDIHRHPNAEEVEYLLEGEGLACIGDVNVRMRPGDIVFAAANDYHGFENTSTTQRAVLAWCYGGASSLEEAGYSTEYQDLEQETDRR